MSLDDRLDALLAVSGRPVSPLPDDEDARALAPLLAAAQRLAPLREAQPSAHFADQVERLLLARVGTLRARAATAGVAPVVLPPVSDNAPAVNGDAPAWPDLTVPLRSPAPRTESVGPARRTRRDARLPVWARALVAACVLLALGSGLFAAAANAQPGSPLFGLHRAGEWAQVALASPTDKARLHLQYASDALAALDRAVAQHSGDPAFSGALDTLRSELTAAASSIAALPAGQTRGALAAQLAALQQRARDDLRAALPGLGWDDRVATTAALGALGESVPRVSNVAIHQIVGQSAQAAAHGTHTVQIVVSGSGFALAAQLIINGRPAGTVLSVTAGTLVAQVSLDPASAHIASVGVENPDGTAAQTTDIGHGPAVMLTPTATPTHHGGHGDNG